MKQTKKHNYQTRHYAAMCNGTQTIVKAYLKENAVSRFRQYDAAITDKDVYPIDARNGQQASIDEVIEEYEGGGKVSYRIEMKKD